jgi:hypothetical protein
LLSKTKQEIIPHNRFVLIVLGYLHTADSDLQAVLGIPIKSYPVLSTKVVFATFNFMNIMEKQQVTRRRRTLKSKSSSSVSVSVTRVNSKIKGTMKFSYILEIIYDFIYILYLILYGAYTFLIAVPFTVVFPERTKSLENETILVRHQIICTITV